MKNPKKEKQARRLLAMVESQLLDVQTLDGGFIMTPRVLRLVLKEHEELAEKWHTLQQRKFFLQRALWNVA